MAYASRHDIETLYSADALYVAERGGDAAQTGAAINRALEQATDEIDAYLRVRYETPVVPVPYLLTQLCVDIALYRLANTADVRSEEHRVRYDDAIKQLTRISKGDMALPVSREPGDPPAHEGPRPIVQSGPVKQFTRDKLEGL